MKSAIEATLHCTAPDCVQRVEYSLSNPNRCSIVFNEGATRNAERIELFSSARSSEQPSPTTFLSNEAIRQVTYSFSQQFGIAREVFTEYQYFWTHRLVGPDHIESNLLTCAYFQPEDPNYFKSPSNPVAIYSHDISFRRGS